MDTKFFKLNEFEKDWFKGYSLAEDLNGLDFVIPSGAIFPESLKREKFKSVRLGKDTKTLLGGDILFNTGGVGTLGRVGFFNLDDSHYTADPFVLVIRFKQKYISPKYIFYMLRTEQAKAQINKRTVGTTGIISIKPKDVLTILLPLPIDSKGVPDLVEQERMVSILEEVELIKKKRISADKKTTELIFATFLKMFGDPIRNPKKWPTDRLDKFCAIETGNTPPRENKLFYGKGTEWIKSDNILDAEIYPAKAKEELSELGLQNGRYVEAGSVLMTCIAGSLNSIGNVCMTDRRVAFNQQINAVTTTDETNPVFLYVLLKILRPQLHKNASQVLKYIINKSNLQKIEVIRPPFPLQEKFVEEFNRIGKYKSKQKQSSIQIDKLFSSLTSGVFNGQL